MQGKKRVAVGMSGGVDSSVAAAMLKEQGYEVTGIFIEAYNEPGCRTDQDKKDALKVATRLDIGFRALDFREEYKKIVVEYFINEYKAGRTPNPDVMCNAKIKFGLFYDKMISEGYDYVATGHYARIVEKDKKRYIARPEDLKKDQSYFLWEVENTKLAKILWPLGDMRKSQVREKAGELGLHNAQKPDSMGVCMLGELNVSEFLREHLGENKGEIEFQGTTVGIHKGLWFDTVGQRVGSEVSMKSQDWCKAGIDPTHKPVLYVIAKDKRKNRLLVGRREECYRTRFMLHDLKLMISKEEITSYIVRGGLFVRIRNLGEMVEVKGMESELRMKRTEILLDVPIFAPAEGQAAVFYDNQGRVVGGGTIVS